MEDPLQQPARVPRRLQALLLALTLLAFLPGLKGELVYDDLVIVARNPLITSLRNVPELFSKALWDFLEPQTAARIGYWRPLSSVALSIGWQLGHGRPFAFHALSLALHLAATTVACRLCWRLTRDRTIAFFAALLFGLHPVHVESVAWISALNDPLFGLLALLALDAHLDWRERGSTGIGWRRVLYFLAALLSKELAVAVLPLAAAIDLGRRKASSSGAGIVQSLQPIAIGYAPLLVALCAYYLARAAVFGDLQAGFDRTTTDFGVSHARLALLRIECLGGFIWLLAWPFELKLFHPFLPEISLGDAELVRALICFAALLIAIVLAWRRHETVLLAALLAIAAALLPPLVRVQSLGTFPLSERFLYLAVLGFTLLVPVALVRWLPRRASMLVLTALAIAFGARTFARTRVWHDEEVLFRTSAAQTPRSPYVQWGLGRVLLQSYRQHRDAHVLADAQRAFQSALDLLEAAQKGDQSIFATRDDHLQANLGLAWTLLYEAELNGYEQDESAYRVFAMVEEHYPGHEEVATGLGVAAMALGRTDEARRHFEHALELNDGYVEAHHNLGLLHMQRGEWKQASASFEQALRLRPAHLDDLLWLVRSLAQEGEPQRARSVLAQTIELYPLEARPRVLQATLAAQDGDLDRARQLVDQALAIDPDDGEALLVKGKILLARDEKTAALRVLERASELMPANFEANYNTAALLLSSSGPDAALPHLIRAYALRPDDKTGAILRETLIKLDLRDVEILARLAAIDARRELDASALDWLDKVFTLDPEHGRSRLMRGLLLRKSGQRDAAVVELERACRALPESFVAHQELGALLAELDRKPEALEQLEHAVELVRKGNDSNPARAAVLEELERTIERLRDQR